MIAEDWVPPQATCLHVLFSFVCGYGVRELGENLHGGARSCHEAVAANEVL